MTIICNSFLLILVAAGSCIPCIHAQEVLSVMLSSSPSIKLCSFSMSGETDLRFHILSIFEVT